VTDLPRRSAGRGGAASESRGELDDEPAL
jgi:hypothetical protein